MNEQTLTDEREGVKTARMGLGQYLILPLGCDGVKRIVEGNRGIVV